MLNPWDKKKPGRKPKGWINPIPQTLQINHNQIKLIFDDDTEGDLKDFMKTPPKKVSPQVRKSW